MKAYFDLSEDMAADACLVIRAETPEEILMLSMWNEINQQQNTKYQTMTNSGLKAGLEIIIPRFSLVKNDC